MSDITITAANVVLVSGRKVSGTAGATITAGQSIYSDASDSGKMKLTDADVAATDDSRGIALHGAADGQPIQWQESGVLNMGATLVVGTTYVVSTTAGGVAPHADLGSGDFVTILGVAITTANLELLMETTSVAIA